MFGKLFYDTSQSIGEFLYEIGSCADVTTRERTRVQQSPGNRCNMCRPARREATARGTVLRLYLRRRDRRK